MKNLKQRLYFFILFSAGLLFTYVSFAEESSNKTKQTDSSEKSAKQSKPNASKRSRIKTLEEFIPSEEVSADKPVAFPSDI